MKRSFLFLLFAFALLSSFLLGCTAEKTADTDETEASSRENTEVALEPYELKSDDALNIDFVQYLKESDEYAFELPFINGSTTNFWRDSIDRKLDSVVYTNDPEYVRYYFPEALVKAYFKTSGLQHFKVYSEENVYLGGGKFMRFEYINQNIEPKVVAVFKLDKKQDEGLYAVCGIKEILPEIRPEYPKRRDLEEYANRRTLPAHYSLENNLQVELSGIIYTSVRGSNAEKRRTVTRLFITENDSTKAVLSLKDNWLFMHLHPIPINYNNKPVLLTMEGQADSDWFESSVYLYKQGRYVLLSGGKPL